MRNTITLNGIASTTIAGLLIQELPAISKPLMRTTIEEIDGRDGDIVTELGYSAYDKEITIGLYGSFDINAVIAYFATEGTVVFSNEPDKFYRYKIIEKIDYERLVRYRTATVKLHCQPFKYPTIETPVQLGSGLTVTAEGTDITMQGTALAPFASVTPKGDTSQTTYTGKNLLKLEAPTASQAAGLTITPDATTGTITFSGTNTGTYPWLNGLVNTTLPAGTYTFSINTALPYNLTVRFYNEDSQFPISATITAGQTKATATTTYAIAKLGMVYSVSTTGVTIPSTTIYPQLESGSTATAFEPYVGGIASPNPDYPQYVKVVTGEQTVTVVTGKNLFNINGTQQPNTRCAATIDGNAITITSTTVGPGYYSIILPNSNALLGKTATISFGSVVSNHAGKVNIYEAFQSQPNSVGGWDKSIDASHVVTGGVETFTFPDIHTGSYDSFAVVLYVGNRAGSTAVGDYTTYSEIQLELGSTATAYEPYQGQEYTLSLTPNLYNPSTVTTGEYLTDTGTIVSQALWSTTDYIPVTAGETYEYSGITNAGNAPYSCYYDANKTFVSSFKQSTGTNTLTIPSGVAFVRFSVIISPDVITFEFRDTPNRIELCKIGTYQDYIYKSGGNWYKHTEIAKATLPTSGYTRWSTQPTACMYYKNGALSDALLQKGIVTAVIENLPVMPQVGNMTEYYNTYAQTNQYGFVLKVDTPGIMIQNTDYAALADFHTWISENPVEVRYVLATATNTQITDTELIEQLEALKSANSYRYVTKLNTAGDGYNMPVIIAATATGEADGTVTNAGNTYAKPKLTIYGTGTIGVYLNGSQMFQIELGSEGHITIDTEKMEAYKDSESNLKNRLVTGDYSKFRLESGANQINFSGNINKCVVENYTRWL